MKIVSPEECPMCQEGTTTSRIEKGAAQNMEWVKCRECGNQFKRSL